MSNETLLSQLEKELPPVLYRNNPRFLELVGVSPRTMANLDSQGKGPACRVRQGRVIGYPREALLEWLRRRLKADNVEKIEPSLVAQKGGTGVGQTG